MLVVKSKVGRKRYIAFSVSSSHGRQISKRDMIHAFEYAVKVLRLRSNGARRKIKPLLMIYRDNRGIVRCAHLDKEKIIAILRSIKTIKTQEGDRVQVEVEPLLTSGTLKHVKKIINSG
jgi:RNase P/RNase MRP subunit POP5